MEESSSGGSGMAYATLWQEATRAVGYIITGITDVFGNRDAAYVNGKQIDESGRYANNKLLLDSTSGSGSTIKIVVLLAGVALVVWLIVKNKK